MKQCFKTYFIRRMRASVLAMMYELGNKSKNYHRMRYVSFCKLHKFLKDDIDKKPYTTSHRSRKKKVTRSCTQQHTMFFCSIGHCFAFFAGRCEIDISLVHGISPSEVHFSTWKVVNTVYNAPFFNIKFPECHEKKEIARKFQAISDFYNCCGAIDWLLTWTPKLNDNDVSVSSVGVKKFFVDEEQIWIKFKRCVWRERKVFRHVYRMSRLNIRLSCVRD